MDRQIGAMDPPNGPAVACDMGCIKDGTFRKIMSSTVKCILIWDVMPQGHFIMGSFEILDVSLWGPFSRFTFCDGTFCSCSS